MEFNALNFGGTDKMVKISSYKIVEDMILISTDDFDIIRIDKSWLDIVKEIHENKLDFAFTQELRILKPWATSYHGKQHLGGNNERLS